MFDNISIAALLARPWLRWALGIAVVASVGFVFLSPNGDGEKLLVLSEGDFVQQVSVSGKVVAANSVDLAFSQTGRIDSVRAKVGETIPQGAIIATIENGDVYADILQKQAAYEGAQATLAQLNVGTRPEQLAVTESEVLSAQVAFGQSRQELIDSIKDAYVKSDDAVRNKVDQLFTNPRTNDPHLAVSAGSQSQSGIEASRTTTETVLKNWEALTATLTSSSDLTAAAETAGTYFSAIAPFLETMARVVSDLQPNGVLTQTTIDKYRTDVATARTNVSTARSALTSAVTGYTSDLTALATAEKKLALEEAGSTNEDIATQEASVKAALADLEKAQALYRKTLIVAPFTGVVTKVDAKVGGIASSNTPLVSMISANTLQVESFVPEINTPLLAPGDSASVTLDAYGESVPFAASVVSIDPAETVRDGVSTYRAILEFTEQDERIRPGMTANILITTEEKQGVLSVPQGIVTVRDGKPTVLVKEGEGIVSREVTTGAVSSSGHIEILSGLVVGDVVVLQAAED